MAHCANDRHTGTAAGPTVRLSLVRKDVRCKNKKQDLLQLPGRQNVTIRCYSSMERETESTITNSCNGPLMRQR